jgi:hypothetical protein
MKRPSFQFYPSDWLRDTALRSCSIGARGLWIDLICYMHEGTPYGHLKVNDKVILPANLARMVGETLEVVEGWLSELSDAGVFQYDHDGSIFSKRMVRDEELRNKRASGGVLGGNPNLINKDKVGGKVNHKVANKVKQNTTPSSSSSSSSSSSIIKRVTPDGVLPQVWDDFLQLRKQKRSAVTDTVIRGIEKEASKAGLSLNDALEHCCIAGWQSFNAEWYANSKSKVADKTYEAPWVKQNREWFDEARGVKPETDFVDMETNLTRIAK